MPRIMIAAIVMVAKTGLSIETRVRVMAAPGSGGLAALHDCRGAGLEALGLHGDHRHAALEALAHGDHAALDVALAQHHRAALHLAALHDVDEALAAFLLHRGDGNDVDLAAHGAGERAVGE